MNHPVNVFLCGYHSVGQSVLDQMIANEAIGKIAVFTHEPGPGVPDLREHAAKAGIWCTTQSVNSASAPFAPDLIFSIYYRRIIKPHVIAAVGGRIVNLHPSLLPRHRGCSSLTWALADGDPVAGITYHYIVPEVDAGNILLQASIGIGPDETQAGLYERAMLVGAAFWPAAFSLLRAGFAGVPQQGASTYHPRGAPHGGEIDDRWPLDRIERFVRAMTNPPYPYARYRGREVRSLEDYTAIRAALSSAGAPAPRESPAA